MTFVTFTSEELTTGPLAYVYPRLGSVGVIIGQMDDEYNVQFSSDCFDEDGCHETAEECAVILSRDEFKSADIFAAEVLNNYNPSNSLPANPPEKKICDCNCNDSCGCHSKEKEEENEVAPEVTEALEIYKMLLPMFKKSNLVTENNGIREGLDVVKMVALAYKNAYQRGRAGKTFFFKSVQSEWREMKPEDVYNSNLEVMYVSKPDKSKYPEGPWDEGDGYYPEGGAVGKMSRPTWRNGERDEHIWVQFEGTNHENTCYGQMFECFLVREVNADD